MNPVKCPICRADAFGMPYHDRVVQFIECPACGSFDVPETTDLLILRELNPDQRGVLSFWLRHAVRGEKPLVLTDELTKRVLKETKLPAPDEQEERLIQAAGDAVEGGKGDLSCDLRYFAPAVGAANERALRLLVVYLLEKGWLSGIRNFPMVLSGQVNALNLALTPDGFRRYRELKARKDSKARGKGSYVFLSHAASDETIALTLKAEIQSRLPGVKVFCSSDPTDLPAGTKWSPDIQKALLDSTMLIFIASDRSLQRPWVWFECGTFWFSERKIVPLCLGGVRKNALHPPLSELQAVNGDDPKDLRIALDSVASATGVSLENDTHLDTLSIRLAQLDRDAAAVSITLSGWFGAEWKGNFLAYEGPYQSLQLIEDSQFERSMQRVLEEAGYRIALYDQNHFANLGEGGRFVQLTDRKSWRSYIASGPQRLVARPESLTR
jgi:TIR domain-containing protein